MLELAVTGLASGGEGVARLSDGRVVFVQGAFPGDTVAVRITQDKPRVVFAEVIEVTTPSPKRSGVFDERIAFSGAPWLGLDYQTQLDAKADTVRQAMERIARVEIEHVAITPAPEQLAYRHRARFHVDESGIGFFARGSHRVIPRELTPVLWPELESAVAELEARVPAGVSELEVAYSRRDGRVVSSLDETDTARYDHPSAHDVWFSAGVFTQAHPAMNDALVRAVLKVLDGQRVLELHAGIGNFSIPMALEGRSVRAVELNRAASDLCRRNAGALPIETVAAPDAKALEGAEAFDCVLMDPPRVGAKEAAQALARRGPKQVVYVSCDAATLARDVATLTQGGYTLTSLTAFDMFPQTPHVESLAVLRR